jgi:DNA-binding NarL/FixJ family response regulator
MSQTHFPTVPPFYLNPSTKKAQNAEHLKISCATVNTHVRNIYGKLDTRNAPAALCIAYRLGLID